MALHYAAKTEDVAEVKRLLTTESVGACDKDGLNALHYVAWHSKKSTETLKLILNHKTCTPDVYNKKNGLNDTPLDIAYNNYSKNVKEEVIELLRQKGCKTSLELESHDVLSRVKYEDYEGSQVSADLSELDRNGCNALHIAAYHNYKNCDILRSLLEHTTCSLEHINKRAFDGLTPLDYAMKFNSFHTREAIIDLLRSHKAMTAAEIDGPAVDITTLSKKERKKLLDDGGLPETSLGN